MGWLSLRPVDLLPWRRFAIVTIWEPDVAQTELGKHMVRPSFLGGGDPTAPFVGSFTGRGFRFRRRLPLYHRNSFLPAIDAVVLPDPRGARVDVGMRLHLFVLVFMTAWMTGATLCALAGIAAALHGVLIGLVFPLPMLAGGALSVGAFSYEARRAERLLRDVFPPAITPVGTPPYR